MQLYPAIEKYLKEAEQAIELIPVERKKVLDKIAFYISQKTDSGRKAHLVFICTHNSRRSHISQLWAAAAAAYYGVEGIITYSGGTEVTAFHVNAIKALRDAGFLIEIIKDGENPIYAVKFSDDAPAITSFSKKYMDTPNPSLRFAAIMTCSQADEGCPLVTGADARISLPYDDPKASDGTPEQSAVYAQRSRDIAIEVLYMALQVKKAS